MFPYFGKIEPLKRALQKNRPELERVYREVLGGELFDMVARREKEELDSRSFSSMSEVKRLGAEVRYITNKFLMLTAIGEDDGDDEWKMQLHPDGSFEPTQVRTASGFVFSEEGFESRRRSDVVDWVSPYLGGYVHEYDHFVLNSGHDVPLMMAVEFALGILNPAAMPVLYEDLPQLVADFNGDRETKMAAATISTWAVGIVRMIEVNTRLLDAYILSGLGYEIPISYFDLPTEQFVPIPFESINSIIVAQIGDALRGYTMQERLDAILNWSDSASSSSQIINNFLDSIRRCQITRATFREILHMMRREKKKKKYKEA